MSAPIKTDEIKKWFFHFHSITCWKAFPIAISCLSLVVAVISLIVHYNFTKNTVRPLLYVGIGNSQSPKPCYGLFIRNNGMGPAKIKSVDIRFDGKPIPSGLEASKYIAKAGFPERPLDFEILTVHIKDGSVLGAGEEILLFAGSRNQISNLGELETVLRRVQVHIKYSSITGYDYKVSYPIKND